MIPLNLKMITRKSQRKELTKCLRMKRINSLKRTWKIVQRLKRESIKRLFETLWVHIWYFKLPFCKNLCCFNLDFFLTFSQSSSFNFNQKNLYHIPIYKKVYSQISSHTINIITNVIYNVYYINFVYYLIICLSI